MDRKRRDDRAGSISIAPKLAADQAKVTSSMTAVSNGAMAPRNSQVVISGLSSRKRPRVCSGGDDYLANPTASSDRIDLRKEADAIYAAFELSLFRDVAFELHRELHTGVMTMERLWAERLHPPPQPKRGGDVYGRVPPKEPSTSITCPCCGRSVGAARYAPHLDKCALGSSRGSRSSRARSSPAPPEAFKPIDSPARLPKPSTKASPKTMPKAAASKPVSAHPLPGRRPPKSHAVSSAARSPPLPPPPPPPPPKVHEPIFDERRESLHILITLKDGAPVQTYHRVLVVPPKADAKQRLEKAPPGNLSAASPSLSQPTRSTGSDERTGSRSPPPKRGPVEPKSGSWSSHPQRSSAPGSTKCRSAKPAAKASSPKEGRPADSRGSSGRRLQRNSSSMPSPSSDDDTLFLSSQSSSGRGSPGSPTSSSPTASKVVPPMLIAPSSGYPRSPPSGRRRKGSGSGGGPRTDAAGGSIPRKDGSRRSLTA